jgi:hypothetical protein
MKADRLANFRFDFFAALPDRDATGQIRDEGGDIAFPFFDHDRIAHGSVLQSGLTQDAPQRARLQIGAQLAGHGHAALLGGMLILAVATPRGDQDPSVVL